MEAIIILLAVFIVILLLVTGFRKAVRDGAVIIPDEGRFEEPIVNPGGTPPVDDGYWRRKYQREHLDV